MEREYLAKFKSRATDIVIVYYRKGDDIYREIDVGLVTQTDFVDSVPSVIYGFEEIGLQDGF